MTKMEDAGLKSTNLCILGHGAGLYSVHSVGSCLDCKERQNARTTTHIQNHLQRQEEKRINTYTLLGFVIMSQIRAHS